MRPLLSREEINALLHEAKRDMGTTPGPSIIDLRRQYIMAPDAVGLDPGSMIELNMSLETPYEIRSQDRLIAYGVLMVLDGKLALRITRLIDHREPNITL